MRTPLAWLDLLYYGKRSLVAVLGLGFSVVSIFMNLGFYDAALRTATLIHDRLDFDILLTSRTYVCMLLTGSVPRVRLYEARSVPGVATVVPFYSSFTLWRDPKSSQRLRMLVLAADLGARPYRMPELEALFPLLTRPDTVVMDTLSIPEYGPQTPGLVKEVSGRHLQIVGNVTFGAGFTSYGTVFTSDQNFSRLMKGFPLDHVSLGLVRVKPGEEVEEVRRRLRAVLPEDTRVVTRAEMAAHETDFWTTVSPIGQLCAAGSVVAFLVGLIIVTQMLTTDVALHMSEYATLKAMGYRDAFLFRTVFSKIFLIALLAYGPALASSLVIYRVAEEATKLPLVMTVGRVVLVFVLTMLIALVAGFFSLRRVMSADPADLF